MIANEGAAQPGHSAEQDEDGDGHREDRGGRPSCVIRHIDKPELYGNTSPRILS